MLKHEAVYACKTGKLGVSGHRDVVRQCKLVCYSTVWTRSGKVIPIVIFISFTTHFILNLSIFEVPQDASTHFTDSVTSDWLSGLPRILVENACPGPHISRSTLGHPERAWLQPLW